MARRLLFALLLLAAAGLPRLARAQTFVAPVGARPIPIGETHVACGPADGGWSIESTGHVVRPPLVPAAGPVVTLKVAPTAAECVSSTSAIQLVATRPWPVLDPAGVLFAVDEERLELRGHHLQGTSVAWATDRDKGSDTCHDPRTEGGVEVCTFRVPRTVSADPAAGVLRWVPPGAPTSSDTLFFGADGKPVPIDAFGLSPSRVEVKQLAPPDASVDVSSGIGFVPLTHPEIVAGVDCGPIKCTLENGNIAVQAPPASVTTLDAKMRLLPHVFLVRKGGAEAAPTLRFSVLRCPMDVASGPALRSLESARMIVRLAGGCAKDVRSLNFFVGAKRVDVVDVATQKDTAYAVLALGSVDAPTLSITATRDEGEGAVVAIARAETQRAPSIRTVLEIPGFPSIDFIPSNRTAIVHYPKVAGGELTLLPVENVYVALYEGTITSVRGDPNAAGLVTLQFGYRSPMLPAPLDQVDLGLLSDSLQRSVKEANIPAPFGATSITGSPLAEVVCTVEGSEVHVRPGITAHVPFRDRDGCRVVFHRERLSAEYGMQKLVLTIDVTKVDGSSRPEAHVDQTFVMRGGPEPRLAWVKGIGTPYDRAVIKLSLAPDESHYLGAAELVGAAPVAQWTMLFGTGRLRLYGTTAIPTGLYRFGGPDSTGVLSLSFGVISRLTWLDSDGKEGLLALEAGVMAFGISLDTSTVGNQPLFQVGAVVGTGLAIPIANPGSATQASINLHLWGEQRLTGVGSEQAVIFGPSISIGNVGTTF